MSTLFVVTGGSRGLGASLVQQAVDRGEAVVSLSRSQPPAGNHVEVDFRDAHAVSAGVAQATRENMTGATSFVLINNAGVLDPIGTDYDVDDIVGNLTVNFVSQVAATRAFINVLGDLPGRRQVMNISSGAAVTAWHGWSLYCSAKAGLEHFGRVVATEQKASDFPAEVVNISPGVMDTEMQTQIRATDLEDFPNRDRFREMHADGKLSTADEVATHLMRGLYSDVRYSGETVTFMQYGKGQGIES